MSPVTETAAAPVSPPSLEEVRAAFPHLEVEEMLGFGGMGAVFLARQPRLARRVALKVIRVPLTDGETDAILSERFEREGRLLARLHHPGIVSVYDSGLAGPFFYLLMEHVDGVNLRQALRAEKFTPRQALAIVPEICAALQYAHDAGVLHRDIKPENILLDVHGRVKLVDFGIARLTAEAEAATENDDFGADSTENLTREGTVLGTPRYMAPEQREEPQSIDHRADIYSLGVVFYELLTGRLPEQSFTPPSTHAAAVDARVDAIVKQALQRERERRQRSANELKTQVETVARSGGKEVQSNSRPLVLTPLGAFLIFMVAAFFLGTGGALFFAWKRPASGPVMQHSAPPPPQAVAVSSNAAAEALWNKEVETARKLLALTQAGYNTGNVGNMELIEARTRLAIAEARVAGNEAKALTAKRDGLAEQLELLKVRHKVGEVPQTEVLEGELELAAAEAELETLKSPGSRNPALTALRQKEAETARRILELTESRYQGGVANQMEVVEARVRATVAEARAAEDERKALTAIRDGMSERLALLKSSYQSGMVTENKVLQAELDLAAAETALQEQESSSSSASPRAQPLESP